MGAEPTDGCGANGFALVVLAPPKEKPVPVDGAEGWNEKDPAVDGRGGSMDGVVALFWPKEKGFEVLAEPPKSLLPNGLLSTGVAAPNGLGVDEAPNENGAGAGAVAAG